MRSPITANVLIDEVIATLKNDITPNIDAKHKYSLLMCINALEISQRSLSENTQKDKEAVPFYDHADTLITDIRSGRYDDLNEPPSKAILQSLRNRNDEDLRISVSENKYQKLKSI